MSGGQGVAVRSTEGRNRDTASVYKATETKRQRGRPKGALNKPKALVPKEMALAILDKMEPMMEKEDYEYHKSVILRGKKIAVERELDILILLLRQQLVPALIAELEGEPLPEGVEDPQASAIKMPEFKKEITERLKVLQSMISLKMQQERSRSDTPVNGNPIVQIFANRQLAGDRLRIAVEHKSGSVGGSTDDSEWESDSSREVPVALLERPISLPGRGESPSDRPVNDDSIGDSSRSVHEVEVSG